MARPELTFDQYWGILQIVEADVEAAVKSNHTYLAINGSLLADPNLYDRMQQFADVWTFTQYALQTTFFISFARIFDGRPDVISIQRLVSATIGNPILFSKASLLARRRDKNRGPDDPDWLAELIQKAWEPTTADLKFLKTDLAPYYEKFKEIYQPIRHRYYAHRGDDTREAIEGLFSKTRIDEVNEILRFVYTLVEAVKNLAVNGRRPDLTDFRRYEGFVTGTKTRAEHFIRQH